MPSTTPTLLPIIAHTVRDALHRDSVRNIQESTFERDFTEIFPQGIDFQSLLSHLWLVATPKATKASPNCCSREAPIQLYFAAVKIEVAKTQLEALPPAFNIANDDHKSSHS